MDSLDMTRHYANHRTFVYDVPRFCNISSDDFMFVANVDRDSTIAYEPWNLHWLNLELSEPFFTTFQQSYYVFSKTHEIQL